MKMKADCPESCSLLPGRKVHIQLTVFMKLKVWAYLIRKHSIINTSVKVLNQMVYLSKKFSFKNVITRLMI
jgi:hypothetical protein